MSLLGTLAKVAIGIAVAKGVSTIVKGQGGGASQGSTGQDGRYRAPHSPDLQDVMKDVFGSAPAGNAPAGRSTRRGADPFGEDNSPVSAPEPQGGSIGDVLGGILGGAAGADAGRSSGRSSGGGLGDLLEEMGKITQASRGNLGGGGSLGDVIGQLGQSGGLGGLLGGLLGGAAAGGASGGASGPASKGFGDLLNDALAGNAPAADPTAGQEAAAGLMLKAMLQAAKSDGRIDDAEQKKLLETIGDASDEEKAFVTAELRAPIDIPGLCAQVPQGLQPQIYGISVMAIELDSKTEAQYLDALAKGLGLGPDVVNQIHAQMGVAPLYG